MDVLLCPYPPGGRRFAGSGQCLGRLYWPGRARVLAVATQKSYFSEEGRTHSICGAHLLRELTALIEQGSVWAQQMHTLLMQLYLLSDKEQSCLEAQALELAREAYAEILILADEQEPPPQPSSRGRPRGGRPNKAKAAT